MSFVHVRQEFQSVGHGTFFTGNVRDFHGRRFCWVYDCGSKRPTRVEQAIKALAYSQYWSGDVELDMVAVSHFDDDHINGLELLLQRHSVKWLVLPFMGIKTRLAHASSLMQGEASSATTAAFTMDPVKYLADRGLSDRIGSILLIRGGPEGGAADGGGELPEKDRSGGPENFSWEDSPEDAAQYPAGFFDSYAAGNPQVKVLSHRKPMKASGGLPFEFVFYNTSLPGGTAKRSKLPLSAVQSDVDLIFRTYRLQDPLRKPRSGWRKSLIRCYDKHFGSKGPERNNISLCVLARPLVDAHLHPYCSLGAYCGPHAAHWSQFCSDWPRCPYCWPYIDSASADLDSQRSDRQALLLTGDLALDSQEIEAMQKHFGLWRWNEIGVTQVPHHGSQHSWETGNAAGFGSSQFVQCVPTVSKHNDHPHPIVVADLSNAPVHVANYENSVVHDFCFRV
jgi:hypothetical protein